MVTELEQLGSITMARYEQQQQSFQRIVGEESRLRTEIVKLDDHLRTARDRSETDIPLRAIGADIIWQGWVGRRKTELNMKLAQVLAIKEHHLVQVRSAYGKVLVVQELIANAQDEKRKKTSQAQLDRAIEQTLFG